MQDWEGFAMALVGRQCMDTMWIDLSGYGVYTKTVAYRFRVIFESFHFFYHLRIVFKHLRIVFKNLRKLIVFV